MTWSGRRVSTQLSDDEVLLPWWGASTRRWAGCRWNQSSSKAANIRASTPSLISPVSQISVSDSPWLTRSTQDASLPSVASGACQNASSSPPQCSATAGQSRTRRRPSKLPDNSPASPLDIRTTSKVSSNTGKPPEWSLSAWLSTRWSIRRIPRALSSGINTESAAENTPFTSGPVSYSRTLSSTRIRTDSPCPTSRMRISGTATDEFTGSRWYSAARLHKAMAANAAGRNPGTGSRIMTTTTSTSKPDCVTLPPPGTGQSSTWTHSSQPQSNASAPSISTIAKPDNPPPDSTDSNAPTNNTGITTRDTQGMANRLASNPATGWPRPKCDRTGHKPANTANCASTRPFSQPGVATLLANTSNNTATAPKESQKP